MEFVNKKNKAKLVREGWTFISINRITSLRNFIYNNQSNNRSESQSELIIASDQELANANTLECVTIIDEDENIVMEDNNLIGQKRGPQSECIQQNNTKRRKKSNKEEK